MPIVDPAEVTDDTPLGIVPLPWAFRRVVDRTYQVLGPRSAISNALESGVRLGLRTFYDLRRRGHPLIGWGWDDRRGDDG